MTTQTEEATRKERSMEALALTREERSEVRPFFEAAPDRKPLVAFDAPPAPAAPPSTW
jgi:hypothetical protein